MNEGFSAFAHLTHSQRRWVLIGLLGLLHLLLLQGIDSGVGRTLLVVHIGLFILWQPFVRAELRLSALQLLVIAWLIAVATWWASNWMLIGWVMALAGIIGGKVFLFAGRAAKLFYLLVLAYLISVLLIVLVPQVLPSPFALTGEYLLLAKYVLPLLFLGMALLPVGQEGEGEAEVVDFVYSAFIFLLLAVLVLGSISAMLLIRRGYFESLIVTMIVLSVVLLLLAWAWNPRLGFAGLGMLFSRYLLSLGLPFERWLHELADTLQREDQPDKFLARSLEGLNRLPWINGCEWRAQNSEGGSGRREGQRQAFQHGLLTLTIFTQQPLSPALTWHFNLLVQLLGEFHEAKLRAQELQQLSYVKAVHQTGARLTHDVKNLLQSLNALCLAAASEGETPSPQYQALLRRQLPVISQRLQQTLGKLRRPKLEGAQFVSANQWWAGLQARYAQEGMNFSSEGAEAGDRQIPATLFNSAAENLLENALAKRQEAPTLQIRVEFKLRPHPGMSVCDDGPAIPETVAEALFRAPIASRAGLGIGLYQAARHAEFYGYELKVASNEAGRVCFELSQLPEEDEPGDL
ncbi:MAG: HAMP domain-containing histidine kinase [Sulfuritalea sp.]|nr:HAMP domain-containing histidine kinase [Sulfuritalea sp.]